MKVAKSYKIVLLMITLVMLIVSSLCFSGMSSVSASAKSPKDYLNGSGAEKASYDSNMLKFTGIKNGEKISFKNDLVVSDFEIKFSVAENSTVNLELESDSYYVNGNKDAEGNFDKEITNKISVKRSATGLEIGLNGKVATSPVPVSEWATVKISVGEDGFVKLDKVNDTEITFSEVQDKYYRIKNVDNRAVAKVTLSYVLAENATSDFNVEYVDQKASDTEGKFKQTFALADDKLDVASSRVTLNDSFYKKNKDGTYEAIKIRGDKSSLSFTYHSVLGGLSTNDLYVADNENVFAETGVDHPRSFRFLEAGETEIVVKQQVGDKDNASTPSDKIDDVELEKVTVKVIEKGNKVDGTKDDKAPEYVENNDANKEAIEGFKNALYSNIKDKTNHVVEIGDEVTVPSLKDLVFDETSSYEDMKYRINYRTISESNSQSNLKIKFDELDDYIFFVTFTDKNDNEMDKELFITENEDGSVTKSAFVFDFKVIDKQILEVKAPVKQADGFKGVPYKASKFDTKGGKLKYTLEYNDSVSADKDSEGWTAIPKMSQITKDTKVDGFTNDELKEINYNGELNFTPIKTGTYRIKCTATSEVASVNSEKEKSAVTYIKVESEPKVVKVDNHWLQNNVWSVVFLSIGTVSFIALIVLLFIKPKDKPSDEE